jgi:phospholipid/cholesterol/gamma-HCH transport system substrate-binding protein
VKATRWSLDDWRLADRNPLIVAAIAAVVLVAALFVALNLTNLPGVDPTRGYSAYLDNASGLGGTETVQISGVHVGKITSMRLDGSRVRVDFEVDSDISLGETTSASVEVLNPLGSEFLELTPGGPGRLHHPIPLSRTQVSRSLLGELGDVTQRVGQIDIARLQKSLNVMTGSLSGTSKQAVTKVFAGLNEFAATLANDSGSITALVQEGSKLTGIINDHRDELVQLVGQGDALVATLDERKQSITRLLQGTSALADQVADILHLNQGQLTPMLDNLRIISDALAKQNTKLGKAIPALAELSRNLARATGSGPFVDIVVPAGILPDNLIRTCADQAEYPAPRQPLVGCRP